MTFVELSKKHSFSPSYTRKRIYDFLDMAKSHPTVDEIYKTLKPELPSLSKTTVYNVLNLFIEKGIVIGVNISSNETRYELDETPHSHFQCSVCKTLYDVPVVETIIQTRELDGFEIARQEVLLKGICPKCKQKG